jgi:hypothetical protein
MKDHCSLVRRGSRRTERLSKEKPLTPRLMIGEAKNVPRRGPAIERGSARLTT